MEPSWRTHLRALLITVALVAHGVHALPLPRPLKASDLEKEWRQDDITMWRGWLEAVGVDVSQEQVGTFLLDWTGFWGDLHDGLRAPFKSVFKITATNQRWALFAAATEKPERIVVKYQDEAGQWHVLLRRLDPPYGWREPQIRQRRVRGIWDGVKDKPSVAYKNLTLWLARLVFVEFEDARAVKVVLERQFATYPWEDPDPRLELRVAREHRRDERMP